jgi:hypothetical protein
MKEVVSEQTLEVGGATKSRYQSAKSSSSNALISLSNHWQFKTYLMYMERKMDSERDDILINVGHRIVRLAEAGQIEQQAMLFP